MKTIRISYNELVEYMYEGLVDFGYAATEEEAEVIGSLVLDFIIETFELDFELRIEEEEE